MKWKQILAVDDLFDDMADNTLLLTTFSNDPMLVEDFQFVHDNNTGARVEFTTGVRDILTKEQIELAKEVSEKAERVMKLIEASCGGELVGLEFKIKGEDSLNRKYRDWEGYASNGGLSSKALKMAKENVHDVLRFTILFEPKDFVQKFFNAEQILRKNHMRFVRVKNTFGASTTYKGVNTFVMAVDKEYNYIFELQFHTKQSWQAKETTHKLYEIERNSQYSDAERSNAHNEQAKIFSGVVAPDNFNLIQEVDYLTEEKVGVI